MLKIERRGGHGKAATTLRLEGQILGPWVDALRDVCERALTGGEQVDLDLGEVSFVDLRGVELLRSLAARGVATANCSGFVAEQLRV